MPEQLYALKRDLDMLTRDMDNLKKSYGLLDYIAKVVHDSGLEQMAQAAQMRRMEDEMRLMRTVMENTENRLSRVEKNLVIIMKHLGINEPK